MNFSKYLHPITQRWMHRVMWLTGETIAEDDAVLVDRTVRELWNSAMGGTNAAPRPTGTTLFPGRKVVAWYPMIGPTIEAARVPVINTTDPRDWMNPTPIGNEMLIERFNVAELFRKNRHFRADIGVRTNPIGGATADSDLFWRTGITLNKLNAANTLQGLTGRCLGFGFSLNVQVPATFGGILGWDGSGGFTARTDASANIIAKNQGPGFGFELTIPVASAGPGAYYCSRRSGTIFNGYKDGAVVAQQTNNSDLATGTDGDLDILLATQTVSGGTPQGNRYAGWFSDVYFTLQVTADEEAAIADIFARHRQRRLNT